MQKYFVGFAVAGFLLFVPSQSDAQVGVRIGLSQMPGLAGIEYKTGNISLGAGPLADGQIAISARYALSAEGNSLWAGLGVVLNRIEVVDSVDGDGLYETYDFKDAPALGPLVGYRMSLNDRLDLSIGAGYGVYLGVDGDLVNGDGTVLNDETSGPLLDLSLGYSF